MRAPSGIALPKATNDLVYAVSGYEASIRNAAQVSLTSDMVFSDGSSLELATIGGSVAGGLTATLTVATIGVLAVLPPWLPSTWLLVMFLSFLWLILTANYDVLDGFLGHIKKTIERGADESGFGGAAVLSGDCQSRNKILADIDADFPLHGAPCPTTMTDIGKWVRRDCGT